MITILLDSSNTNLSVGVARDNSLLESISYEAWQQQSEYMIPELDKLFNKYGITKDDIGEVVVAIGPGSYTGVRIAITIAKTICVSLGAKLYVISSLRTLKDGNQPSICLINARSGRSYMGIYQGSEILLNDQIMKNEDVLKYISEHPSYSICGSTQYLGIEGKMVDSIKEMLNSKDYLKVVNPLSLKPVYMKD